MTSHQKMTTEQATSNFLFRRILANPDFQAWSANHDVPDYITDNLASDKKLRPYQEDAVKTFIWLFEHDRPAAKHLLFNMATGTGKTLVMACCILYLYIQGYRNFIFTVSSDNIIKQAMRNLTDVSFDKYLFNKNGVRINGRRVNVNLVRQPMAGHSDDINITFAIINTLYNRLREPRENQLSIEDFKDNKIVIIADEAHHLNVDTKSKKKKEADEAKNWETVIRHAIDVNPDNMLLEFTATVDLKDSSIREKYIDKLVYRYSFLEFNKDGYSKAVRFMYSPETSIENQKRYLIVNAVALSEFRRLFAQRTMHADIKPIVLIKSRNIKDSEADRAFFDKVISSLTVDDLKWLKVDAEQNQTREHRHEYEIEADMFAWINDLRRSGLADSWNRDAALQRFVQSIQASFTHDNTLIYNSQKKEQPDMVMQLDNPRCNIRAVFSVNALNEGWDVLSLFDIIHFDISASKKPSMQDIQLIGRGARYCPYTLPRSYHRDRGSMMDQLNLNLATDKYKRKFDNDPTDTARALETMVYHFVEKGTFMENLQKDLLGAGIINDGVETRTIHMKQQFMASDTYLNGFVYCNTTVKRQRTTDDEIDTTFEQPIPARKYRTHAVGLTDKQRNNDQAGELSVNLPLTPEIFGRRVIEVALLRAENNFFRFANLRRHVVGLKSIDDFIDNVLSKCQINYVYEQGLDIESIDARAKMQLLVGSVLPEVRRRIDVNMPFEVGSTELVPLQLSSVFEKNKTIYLTAFPVEDSETGKMKTVTSDERGRSQTYNEEPALRYDVQGASWYAYDENYGTSEEKKLVKWLGGQIPMLRDKFPGCEIYLIRNELDFYLCSLHDGRRFSPDYLLIINDVTNHRLYYQVIIEPKGGHIMAKDQWKEQLMLDLNKYGMVDHKGIEVSSATVDLSNGFGAAEGNGQHGLDYDPRQGGNGATQDTNHYQEVIPLGLPFFNYDDTDQLTRFSEAWQKIK